MGPIALERPDTRSVADGAPIDFDLHGIVGVRLLGATPADAAAVSAQLGPIRAALRREPDIVLRFTERLAVGSTRHIGVQDAAFTEDAFLVLRTAGKARARVQVPIDRLGRPCEVVCEHGLPAVPLLVPMVNLAALAKGVLPLHASAFSYRGTGALVTGWSKGGKTEALLGFMARGARYIGDEWVYVSADGRRLHGIPEPITVWDAHLRDLPRFRGRLTGRERVRLRAGRAMTTLEGLPLERTRPTRLLRRALRVAGRQGAVWVEPQRLFGPEACAAEAAFDRLFFVVSHDAPAVTVTPVSGADVARRMVFSLLYERIDLRAVYWQFRFAFPERLNPVIEEAEPLQRALLEQLFDGRPAYEVAHPHPVPIVALVEAMEACL